MVQQNPRTAPRQPLTKHSSELSLRTFSLNVTKLDRYFDGNNYVNHNPRIADGVDHLRDRLLSTTRTPFRFDTVRMVLGEGGVRSRSDRRNIRRQEYIVLRLVPGSKRQNCGALGCCRGGRPSRQNQRTQTASFENRNNAT